MTITLPPDLAAAVRSYASRAHRGKFSPAIAELTRRGLDAVTSVAENDNRKESPASLT